ncbi:uncharacterized protein LOC18432389 [Amborella trichopoda]|uniref:uncharacterized protein LOC18432389 n=1 Tax=Amborella trichopoda TaxID=13333 RepID=UPI0009BE0050|nr:uncharacterized protein LOC18432389 [Amborella trichopoda]|eukprot:XP_011622689.2 uncharacterized protein LOC18432389 [Amborella trichopoda]
MEEEKKKKKNKKKKSKQNKNAEATVVNGGETSNLDKNELVNFDSNHKAIDLVAAKNNDAGSSEPEVKQDVYEAHKMASILFMEKLEEEVRQLEEEKQSWILREARLDEEIKSLKSEKHLWLLKETEREEASIKLKNELLVLRQKETSAGEEVARLSEVNADLEIQIKKLEESRGELLEERQQLMVNINHLESRIHQPEIEIAVSAPVEHGIGSFHSSSEVKKQESVHHMEPASDEIIIQRDATAELVNKLIAQNSELVEKVNELKIQLDHLKNDAGKSPSHEFQSKPNVPSARSIESNVRIVSTTPMHKEIDPNSVYIDEQRGENVLSYGPVLVLDPAAGTARDQTQCHDPLVEINMSGLQGHNPVAEISEDGVRGQYPAAEIKEDGVGGRDPLAEIGLSEVHGSYPMAEINLDGDHDSGSTAEIRSELHVSHPSAEMSTIEIAAANPTVEIKSNDGGIPLSDAPLIGAPFRMLSFFAKYVTGADLVKPKNLVQY